MKLFHPKKMMMVPFFPGSLKGVLFFTTVLIVAGCAVFLCVNGYRFFHLSGRYIAIEMKTSVAGYGQVYFDVGLDYDEKESFRFRIKPTSSFQEYRIPLPESIVKSVRFDPLDETGPFEIKSLKIETRDERIVWEGDRLVEQIVPLQQIVVQSSKTIFAGFSTGKDPNFHVKGFFVPENRDTVTRTMITIVIFTVGIALISFICFLVTDVLIRSGHLYPRKEQSISLFLKKIFAGLSVLLIVVIYLWTATSNDKPFHFRIGGLYDNGETLYVDLAESFLWGRLSLLIEPPEELLSLPDPYDPAQNSRFRLHDASLYLANYYLYFGPAPVLTTFIPWRLITGNPLPHNLAGSIYAVGGFVFSVLILMIVIRGTGLKISFPTIMIGILALGMCNIVLVVLRTPFMYEVASLSAYFWSTLSLFFIFSFLLLDQRKITYLIISSLCYGLAIASRFSYVYGVLIFLIPLWCCLDHQSKISRDSLKRLTLSLLAVGMPIVGIVGTLLLYNYFRFGNFFEFGLRYQLGILRPLDYPFLSIQNIWVNNYLHFFHGHLTNSLFPFFHMQPVKIPGIIPIPIYYPLFWVQIEPAAGILANIPFLCAIIPAWFYLKFMTKCVFPKAIQYFAFLLLLGSSINWIVVSLYSYASIRYVIDFLPMFLLLSCLIYFMIYDHYHKLIVGRVAVQCIAITTVVYSILVNMGLSIGSGGQIFKKGNPELYKTMEHFFDIIPHLINQLS